MLHHFAFRKQKQVWEKHVIVLHVFRFTVNGIILRGDQAWGATETCRVVRRWVGPGGGARRTVTRRGWELTWDWREGEARLSGVGGSADIVSPRLWTWPFLPPRFPLFFSASSLLSQCRCSVSCFNYFRILIISILLALRRRSSPKGLQASSLSSLCFLLLNFSDPEVPSCFCHALRSAAHVVSFEYK